MKNINLISLIILIFFTIVKAELNSSFLYSTVLISHEIKSGSISTGTGFLVFKELNSDEGHVFLITNKHVLPTKSANAKISVRVNIKGGQNPDVANIDIPIYDNAEKGYPHVILNSDPSIDVAAVQITEFIIKNSIEAIWLPYEIFGTKDKLKSEKISVGDEIFLLGYPDAIYDSRNIFPILRQGTIATVPIEGYGFNKRLQNIYKLPKFIDGFLIDANVYPGSSGSLVILKPQATTIGPHGETVVSSTKKRPYLLGIVSMSIPIVDTNLRSVQRMGLGVVYSVETIIETIEAYYKN